jgi:tetratricopeptide (TPR) repeat protein
MALASGVLLSGCASHDHTPQSLRIAKNSLSEANEAFERNQPYQALNLVQTALKNHQLSGDLRNTLIDMNRIGYIYNALGQYPKALSWFQRALLICEVLKDPLLKGQTYALLSDTEIALKNSAQANAFLSKAFALIEPLPSSREKQETEAHLYNTLGLSKSLDGKWAEALKNFQTAQMINQNLGDKRKEAGNWANIGGVHLATQNFKDALTSFQDALKIDLKIANSDGIAFDSEGVALANYHMGEWDSAMRHIIVAYQIRLLQGNKDQAEKDYRLSQQLFKKIPPLSGNESILLHWPAPAS